MQTTARKNYRYLTQLALLTAIIILMSFTPLGFLTVGPLSITFLMIPVAVGAIVMGPKAGLILGLVFGLCSFLRGLMGTDAMGTLLIQINPFYAFLVCVVPRTLMGWLTGLIFKGLYRIDRTRLVSYAVASLASALINTVFFMGSMTLLYYQTVLGFASESGLTLWPYLMGLIAVNCPVESGIAMVVGTAVSKILYRMLVEKRGAGA